MRLTKNNVKYTYDGEQLLKEDRNGTKIYYYHGTDGIAAFEYNGAYYYYAKNMFGDVTEILSNGNVVARYRYDAFGNHKVYDGIGDERTEANFIGNINPIRYRSYYYDTETGLYYLQTRYYDPEIGRFISPDSIDYLDPETVNGLNLYAYCYNNPVTYVDPSGNSPWSWVLSGLSIIAGVILCATGVGTGLGISMIIGGTTSMASNIMSAAGVDGKTASIVNSSLNIIAGIVLCFTPFASMGASMIGSGIGGLTGGYISESLGGSFELGAGIGNIVGGIAGGQIYKGLQRIGVAGVRVKLSEIKFNPQDEFSTLGPSDEALTYWTRKLANNPRGYNSIPNRYNVIEKIKIVYNSGNTLANGHHRVYVMKYIINNAPKYIKVFYSR